MIRRSALRGTIGVACALPLLVSAPALGAGVVVEDPSPADGAQIQTKSNGVTIPVDWQLDSAGCAPSSPVRFSSQVENLTTPGAPVLGFVANPDPNGPATLTRNRQVNRDTDVRWTVTLTCSDALNPAAPIMVTGGRTFRLLAPDLRARAAGRYFVRNSGFYIERGKRKKLRGSDLYTFKPLCKVGPCRARLNIRGVGNTLMRYNGKKKRWTGVVAGTKVNKMFRCRSTRTGKPVNNAYRGRVTITLTHKRGKQRVVGVQTRSTQMVGRLRGTLNLSANGKRQRCAKVLMRGVIRADAR